MLKLLHTADIHLGAKFIGLGEKGRLQREQVRESFKKIVSLALDEHVDIVLVAGDLFDTNQQSQRNIDLVIEQLNRISSSNIPVCLIPGTHDCYDSGSIYEKFDFEKSCPNLTIFKGENWEYKEFPALDLTVYGRPNLSNRSYTSPLSCLSRLTQTKYHVALVHGSLNIPGQIAEDDHVFSLEQIRESGMQYIALGHWHRPYACTNRGIIAQYAGPPEMIATDQKEHGSVLLVTILDSGSVESEVRQTGVRYVDELKIDMSEIDEISELRSKITEGSNPDLVRRVILQGLRDENILLSTGELESDLVENFFHLRIDDESHPRIAEFSEELFQDQLILTKFINLMKEHIESCQGEEREIAEEALQYGFALLQGKEVI